MGRGAFIPQQTGDPVVDRNLQELAAYLGELDARLSAARSEPGVTFTARGTVMTAATAVVVYNGPGGHTIALPPAGAVGTARSRPMYILNASAVAITVAAAGRDIVNGAGTLSLAGGAFLTCVSDGIGMWMAHSSAAPDPVTVATPWFSLITLAQQVGGAVNLAGNYTVGSKFSSSRAIVCRGVRFYWASVGSAKTVKVRIWKLNNPAAADSTSLDSKDVAVNASGVYEGLFTTPLTLASYVTHYATMYETSGGSHTYVPTAATGSPLGPMGAIPVVGMVAIGPYTICHTFQRFRASADNWPDSTTSAGIYPVEPLLDPVEL